MSEKKISKKEFESALTDLNEWLASEGKSPVVVENLTSEQKLHVFVIPIIEALESGKAGFLPKSVIAFYNDHLADSEPDVEEEVENAAKQVEAPKPVNSINPTKKLKRGENRVQGIKPWAKPVGKEKLVYTMVLEGKSDEEIEAAIRAGYDETVDPAFVDWRVFTYMLKGKNFVAKEDPVFAERWAVEKRQMQTVPDPKKATELSDAEKEARRIKKEEIAAKKAEKESRMANRLAAKAEKEAKKAAKAEKVKKKKKAAEEVTEEVTEEETSEE